MLYYAGEVGEVGNGYTASFAAAAISQDTYCERPVSRDRVSTIMAWEVPYRGSW